METFKLILKTSLRRVMVKNRKVIWVTHYLFRIYNKLKYSKIYFNREKIDLFDIDKLCLEMPYTADEMIFDNNVYGIGNVLKKYSGYKGQINAYIEHGVYFGNHYDKNQWYAEKIITFSDQRKRHLSDRKVNKEVNVIGPYIYYAKELFSKDYRRLLKEQLKKTLLVFPVHSAKSLETKFDIESFIAEIMSLKRQYLFDSILVCLYWKDVKNIDLVNLYKNQGCKVCTAGHKWDKDFLNRLKTIICLAEVTVSNDVGTHIGYCTVLDKPHTILKSKIEFIPKGSHGDISIMEELKEERLLEVNEVRAGFLKTDGSLNIEIDENHKLLSDKYWGHDKVKSKNALFSILS
jgi:hypothetical protein